MSNESHVRQLYVSRPTDLHLNIIHLVNNGCSHRYSITSSLIGTLLLAILHLTLQRFPPFLGSKIGKLKRYVH